MEIVIGVVAIMAGIATVVGVVWAIFKRESPSNRASGAGVVAPDNQGTIETRGETAISGHAVGADRGGQVIQNIGLPGEDHDRLARVEAKLDEFVEKVSDPRAGNVQIADLAAETTSKAERMLDEALAFLKDGRYQDAIEHVLSAYDRELPPRARAELHLVAGNAFHSLSDYGAAEMHYREASRAAPSVAATLGFGLVCAGRGDLDGAEKHYRKALTIAESIGDSLGRARGFGNLGNVYAERGDSDGAKENYRTALEIFQEMGDRSGEARAFGNLGNVYAERGDSDGAEENYRTALEIFQEIGDRSGEARGFGNLGNLYSERGDFDGAEENYRKALVIFEEIGDELGQAQDLANLGGVCAERGDFDGAVARLMSALKIAEEIGARVIVGHIQGMLEQLKATND